jgi:hypothetical protein
VVKKAGAIIPLKTRVLEMVDDLNQFFAEDIGIARRENSSVRNIHGAREN